MKHKISKLLLAISVVLLTTLLFPVSSQAAYVAPYVPAGCVMVTNVPTKTDYPYPYKLNSSSITTGWYVYCGNNPNQFQYAAGVSFKNLPTGFGTSMLRDKFQNYNFTLYVFTTAAQAQSLLGVVAIPADVMVPGVAGVTKSTVVAPATTPFIAVWEKVVPNGGGAAVSYAPSPSNEMQNFSEIVAHETGHGTDTLATTAGSGSSIFQNRITSDIAIFNAKNGCALGGTDSTLWNTYGSRKTIICDGAGNKRPDYASKSNIQIVREFYPTASAWTRNFLASSPEYNELWAQLIAIKRVSGNRGPLFAELDTWMNRIYVCGKSYTDALYTTWQTPGACP